MPIPVFFGTKTDYIDSPEGEKDDKGNIKRVSIEVPNQINNPSPAWTKAPVDLKQEDYDQFYRELYPMTFEQPLFHIHLNVDYPFNLTGILYFPKIKENVEVQRNKIVPEFLTLLHGVIDSPDIPLNVSRSYLQSDGNVKKISAHITKKVADKLAEMFKKDRPDFEAKWPDLQVFVQYGMLSEEKFAEKAKDFSLFKNTDDHAYTIQEFIDKVKPLQTDKNNKTVLLYTHSTEEQYAFVKKAKERGYEVLVLDGPLAPHWISKLEQTFENISFARVDADSLDKLIQKTDEIPSKLTKEDEEKLKPLFEAQVNKEKFTIQFESMSEQEAPIIITQPEFIRRMMEQQKLGGGGGFYGAFPEMFNLTVNANHPAVAKLLEQDSSAQENSTKQLVDLAMLAQGLLKGEDLTAFVKRSFETLK